MLQILAPLRGEDPDEVSTFLDLFYILPRDKDKVVDCFDVGVTPPLQKVEDGAFVAADVAASDPSSLYRVVDATTMRLTAEDTSFRIDFEHPRPETVLWRIRRPADFLLTRTRARLCWLDGTSHPALQSFMKLHILLLSHGRSWPPVLGPMGYSFWGKRHDEDMAAARERDGGRKRSRSPSDEERPGRRAQRASKRESLHGACSWACLTLVV